MICTDMCDESGSYTPAITLDRVRIPSGVTAARLGLGAIGAGLPTDALLAFSLDHARARDAVHRPINLPRLQQDCAGLGLEILMVNSAASDRETYLRRPDYGRRLCDISRTILAARQPCL